MKRGGCFLAMALWLCVPVFSAEKAAPGQPGIIGGNRELNSIVATVNGRGISLGEVMEATSEEEKSVRAVYRGSEAYDRILELRRAALERIIDRKLLVEAYEKTDFRLSAQELERALDQVAEEAGIRSRRAFEAKIRAEGGSLERIRDRLHEQMKAQVMLMQRMRQFLYVSPAEVKKYYEEHQDEFTVPEQWKITVAEHVSPEQETELKGNPAAFSSGLLKARTTTVPRMGLRPEWVAATGGKPEPGKVYGPVESPAGKSFFRVDQVIGETRPAFAGIREAIQEKLEREARKRIAEEYFRELRADAIIRMF